MRGREGGRDTHKLISLFIVREERSLLLLLVLDEGLDIHIEAVTAGALGRLGRQLTLLKQEGQQRKQRVSE